MGNRDKLAHRVETREAESDNSANERRNPPPLVSSRQFDGGPSNTSAVASNFNGGAGREVQFAH